VDIDDFVIFRQPVSVPAVPPVGLTALGSLLAALSVRRLRRRA
jgi:hypothetical protein